MPSPANPLSLSPSLRLYARNSGNIQTDNGNLMEASNEWAKRDPEERFWNFQDAIRASDALRDRLTFRDAKPDAYDIQAINNRPALVHVSSGRSARISPLATDQISRLVKAPVHYLRTLPGSLAADCLRDGWQRVRGSDALRLQIMDAGSDNCTIRAITSPTHDYLANSVILQSMGRLVEEGKGWKIPPARPPQDYKGEIRKATEADVLKYCGTGLSPKVGDDICASGLYVSDRDCFAIIVDDREAMDEEGGMYRFFIVSNSETATGPLKITSGRMRGICGNHIVWDVSDVINIRAIHRGDNASRNVHRLAAEISRRNWKDDRKEMSALIHAAKACQIAANKEELISLLFGKKIASKRDAEIAWNVNAELSSIDGPTGSAWGIVNALTRMSQFSPYMADRTDMDASAGKILSFVSNWMGKGSLY